MHEVLSAMKDKMEKSTESFKGELAKIRTGRASASLLDTIKVDAYGTQMPLNQVATVTVPESRVIAIQAWDKKLMGQIEKAIQKSDLGMNPVNDGKIIRITIPQLTEERRKELVKVVKKITEDHRVAVRNCRRDAIDTLKKLKNDKELTEDELFKMQEEAQSITDECISKIDSIMEDKEKEVMEV